MYICRVIEIYCECCEFDQECRMHVERVISPDSITTIRAAERSNFYWGDVLPYHPYRRRHTDSAHRCPRLWSHHNIIFSLPVMLLCRCGYPLPLAFRPPPINCCGVVSINLTSRHFQFGAYLLLQMHTTSTLNILSVPPQFKLQARQRRTVRRVPFKNERTNTTLWLTVFQNIYQHVFAHLPFPFPRYSDENLTDTAVSLPHVLSSPTDRGSMAKIHLPRNPIVFSGVFTTLFTWGPKPFISALHSRLNEADQ